GAVHFHRFWIRAGAIVGGQFGQFMFASQTKCGPPRCQGRWAVGKDGAIGSLGGDVAVGVAAP
ncbi:MAG: hypothetical protein VXY07_15535, partial [Planctomycetota bacterium]|nr:hypothetical protein [Planctomycetota bacterium]